MLSWQLVRAHWHCDLAHVCCLSICMMMAVFRGASNNMLSESIVRHLPKAITLNCSSDCLVCSAPCTVHCRHTQACQIHITSLKAAGLTMLMVITAGPLLLMSTLRGGCFWWPCRSCTIFLAYVLPASVHMFSPRTPTSSALYCCGQCV